MRQSAKSIERGENQWNTSAYYFQARNLLDNRFNKGDDYPYDFSTYPEYKERGFRGLTFELDTTVRQPGHAGVQEARADYDRLVDLGYDTRKENDTSQHATLGAVKKSIEILEHLQANTSLQL